MTEYPPFRYHNPSPGTLRSLATTTSGKSAGVDAVLASVRTQHQAAVDAADGALEDPVTGAKAPTEKVGNDVIQAVTFCGGCIDKFADAVEVFDSTSAYPRSIIKLNAAWQAGLDTHFGVASPDYRGLPLEDRQSLRDSYDADVAAAKAALVRELQGEHATLTSNLDTSAGSVADLLKAGPTEAAVRSLWAGGNLPPTAIGIWPSLGLRVKDLTPAQQQQVRDYFLEHPEVLTSRQPWVDDAINDLPADMKLDVQVMQRKQQLHDDGLLDDPKQTNAWYDEWVRNTIENDVSLETVTDIARRHDIRPDDFDVLVRMDSNPDSSGNAMQDNTGKWFFLLPTDISGDDAEKAVLMTYIMNAGTGYRDGKDTNGYGDLEAEAYDANEVQRIIDRQHDNDWSYDDDVSFVHGNGGRLVTTPNGMIMGAGGNWLQDKYSLKGGTTWGDIFMLNMDDSSDPAADMHELIERGHMYDSTNKDVDRLLHHEERHSQQWAREGYARFAAGYVAASATAGHWESRDNPGIIPGEYPVWVPDQTENSYEQDAGLTDGNYTADP